MCQSPTALIAIVVSRSAFHSGPTQCYTVQLYNMMLTCCRVLKRSQWREMIFITLSFATKQLPSQAVRLLKSASTIIGGFFLCRLKELQLAFHCTINIPWSFDLSLIWTHCSMVQDATYSFWKHHRSVSHTAGLVLLSCHNAEMGQKAKSYGQKHIH